jgi:S-layer homology domain.
MKKNLSIMLLLFLLLPIFNVEANAETNTSPGYRIEGVFDQTHNTLSVGIYITGGKATVGQFGLHYNNSLLSFCDVDWNQLTEVTDFIGNTASSYLTDVIRGENGVVITSETNHTSDLVSLSDGNIYFAWYQSGVGAVDASAGAVRIATLNFKGNPNVTTAQLYAGMIGIAPKPQNMRIKGWEAGAMVMDDQSNLFFNTSGDDQRKCTVVTEYQNIEFQTIHKAYVTGYTDGTFLPQKTVTRAEAVALLSRLSETFDENATYTSVLSDVKKQDWFANYVGFCSENKIIGGYADGTFLPNQAITRAEFAKIICQFLNLSPTVTNLFSDVEENNWASGYIGALKKANMINGYSDGSFAPNNSITRAEAVKILNAAMNRAPEQQRVDAYLLLHPKPFSDVESKNWAFYEILEASITHSTDVFHK